MDFNNIDAYKVAQELYSTKPSYFPGNKITNLNEFNNTCYSILSEFSDSQNPDIVKYTPGGIKCQQAMIDQLYQSGRTPCKYQGFEPPVINYSPQHFKNAYKKTGDIKHSLEVCLQKAGGDAHKEKMCHLSARALEYTLKDTDQTPPCPPPQVRTAPELGVVESYTEEKNVGCDQASVIFWAVIGGISLLLIILGFVLVVKQHNHSRRR